MRQAAATCAAWGLLSATTSLAQVPPSSVAQPATVEWTAGFEKTQQSANFMRDADAYSFSNVRSLSDRTPEPKRTVGTQVHSVQPLVNLQCGRKPSRPTCQISEFVGFAEPLHQVDSFKRLNGPQQHSCANPWLFSGHVEHVRRPIDEVNISKAPVHE